MKILAINGSPKPGGFSAEALTIVVSFLEKKGAEVQTITLADRNIKDCTGCSTCLKTGKCTLKDDMEDIIAWMKDADGFVIASGVRNGLPTALYKRFYERITYILGFPLLLEDKYTLAISSVGYFGGKASNKRLLGLQDVCCTKLSKYIFCKNVGIPARKAPEDMREQLEKGAFKLFRDIDGKRQRRFLGRLSASINRKIMNRFIFAKYPGTYANVIDCWKRKGYIK